MLSIVKTYYMWNMGVIEILLQWPSDGSELGLPISLTIQVSRDCEKMRDLINKMQSASKLVLKFSIPSILKAQSLNQKFGELFELLFWLKNDDSDIWTTQLVVQLT